MMATACTSSLTRENQLNCNVCAFLLSGKVQGVKLRRYVEAAGRNFQVGGYVINTDDGNVFGEAWIRDFATWIRGKHTRIVYTNVKPTPLVRHILIWHVLMHTVWTTMKEITNG